MELHYADASSEDEPTGAAAFQLQPFQKIALSLQQYSSEGAASASTDGTNDAPPRLLSHVNAPKRDVWYATEKIHGAQLQVYAAVEGNNGVGLRLNVRAAKRSGWLEGLDSFFGFQEVLSRLASSIAAMITSLQRAAATGVTDVAYVVLYGELFGGWYPNAKEAARWQPVTGKRAARQGLPEAEDLPVQEGVYYSPRKEFAVFDIATVDAAHQATLLPFHQTVSLCDTHGLLRVPIVTQGPYTTVNSASVAFDSLVPSCVHALYPQVSVSALPGETNLAEGVVIRPDSGATDVAYKGARVRQLVKHKHPRFAEVEEIERPNGSEPPLVLVERVWRSCLNFNRIAAVSSKLGPVAPRAQLVACIVEDIDMDFWEVAPPVYQTAFSSLTDADIDAAKQRLMQATGAMLAALDNATAAASP